MPNWCVSCDASRSSQDATYRGSPPKSASDKLVDDNLLLKLFLVCHSSHILQPQELYIFHFTREQLMNLLCSLFGFYTKLNEILKTNLDAFLFACIRVS